MAKRRQTEDHIPEADIQWLKRSMALNEHDTKPLPERMVDTYFVVRNMRTRFGKNLNAPLDESALEMVHCMYFTNRQAIQEDADARKLREQIIHAEWMKSLEPGDIVEVMFRDEWQEASLVSRTEKQVRAIIHEDTEERPFNQDRVRQPTLKPVVY
tara:strand:+ start:584 stop:1051 length:468 start_codon:yes stop_codon:yes gene_type:complete